MESTKKEYYPYFDYVRFIAASIVMFGHDRLIDWGPSGSIAVDVFFALSGWLIGGILLHTSRKDLPRFYFNRAVRIWIPYFIALFLIIFVSLLKDPITFKWFEFIVYKLTSAVVPALNEMRSACYEAITNNVVSFVEGIEKIATDRDLYESMRLACPTESTQFLDRKKGLTNVLRKAIEYSVTNKK
ncbi:hypothetical protein A9Q79_03875 [Methylophaga sp. 42_25_T18]|nr:hypothetical protein A9Q79_03875 [Methylophaga sp. 42_25_T18]